jgi:DNA-directed RNA polymerase specialized sigma24 family protein
MGLDDMVRATLSGDLKARTELGEWMYAELRRFFGQCFNQADSDVLVHATVTELLAKLPEYTRREGEFPSWVLGFAGIATRRRKAQIGRERARQAALQLWVHAPSTSPLSAAVRLERWSRILRYLPELPEKYRLVLEHELAGGDDEAYAAEHEISVQTARTRRYRARQLLKALVKSS